jgi:hypothetical protein
LYEVKENGRGGRGWLKMDVYGTGITTNHVVLVVTIPKMLPTSIKQLTDDETGQNHLFLHYKLA